MEVMWDVCLFLSQIAICVFIIDCIFQMLKDFVPSGKTIFGAMAIIAGFIGLSRLKDYLNAKDAQKKAGAEIHNNTNEEKSN
jgi:hypothetical protein